MAFLFLMDESTGSFRKICNARVIFSLGSLKVFLFSFSVSSSMLLLKLWMKGPGYFNRNTFILQLKLSIFLSGWLGKEKSVILCLLKAREEYPLARGVIQYDCRYASIFEDTDFRQQNCTCLLAEIH